MQPTEIILTVLTWLTVAVVLLIKLRAARKQWPMEKAVPPKPAKVWAAKLVQPG